MLTKSSFLFYRIISFSYNFRELLHQPQNTAVLFWSTKPKNRKIWSEKREIPVHFQKWYQCMHTVSFASGSIFWIQNRFLFWSVATAPYFFNKYITWFTGGIGMQCNENYICIFLQKNVDKYKKICYTKFMWRRWNWLHRCCCREHTAGESMYSIGRCYSGAVSGNRNVSSALKDNEESTTIVYFWTWVVTRRPSSHLAARVFFC